MGFQLPLPQLVSSPDFRTINSITKEMVQSHTFSGVAEGRKPQPWLKHGVPSVMVDWGEALQNGLGL